MVSGGLGDGTDNLIGKCPYSGPEGLAEETRRDGRAWRMGSSLRKYLGESGELCTYLSNRGMLPFDIPIF